MNDEHAFRDLIDKVDGLRDEIVDLTSDLVRFDTQNVPPSGNERPCQEFVATWLRDAGLEVNVIEPDSIPGFTEHALYHSGRDYSNRPNVVARIPGSGGGKSFMLSGHIDTVPAAPGDWSRPPLEPAVDGGVIRGLGAFDMKGGVAASMSVMKLLASSGVRPAGDVYLETVSDEEHAGANGTLANRIAGYLPGGVLLSEPSGLELYSEFKGFRIVHITLRGKEGLFFAGEETVNPVEYLGELIAVLLEFRELRKRSTRIPPLYAHDPDPIPVMLPKLKASSFDWRVPMQIPESCTIEVYWQTMPGEDRTSVERQFFDFLEERLRNTELSKRVKIEYEFSHRWMPGASTAADDPFVLAALAAASGATGTNMSAKGAPYPCDMFVFRHFDVPGVVLGPRGKNAHAVDEEVEIESLVDLSRAMLMLIEEWCR